ncbi:PqiC family protein [Succinivibrio dextrinosolvens]|uniref:PqiC family protein n=1 Tax=Succinivibrio dextrinosolvens TaxID=83771 RepID=UPI0024798B45|nr:ABC-type transport auxiliary lipoprotein family protein [Succinivibrio dextrinosolvens]
MKKLTACVVSCLFLLGCTSQEISYDRYSLVEDVSSQSFNSQYDIAVDLFSTLEDGGIVLKTTDVTLRAANHHRWASDLKSQIAVILNKHLSDYQVRNDLDIDISVSKFYGSVDGNVYIDLFADVKLDDRQYFHHGYSFTSKQEEDGYASLVKELKRGINSIGNKFAQDLSLKE